MGKKPEKSKPKSSDGEGGIALNRTAKFAVFDAPGVTQSVASDASTTASPAKSTSGAGSGGASGGGGGLQGRRANLESGPRIASTTSPSTSSTTKVLIGGNSFQTRTPNPSWIADRERAYDEIAARRAEELALKQPVPIIVTMPDGTVLTESRKGGKKGEEEQGERFMAWRTTPYDVACCISQGLADSSVVARVTYENYVSDYDPEEDGMGAGGDVMMGEGEEVGADDDDGANDEGDGNSSSNKNKPMLWDLTRPLVGSVARLELLKFDSDPDAKTTFWHSSAHMLGEALEHLYGCRLTIGPPLAGGFYYDSYMGSGGGGGGGGEGSARSRQQRRLPRGGLQTDRDGGYQNNQIEAEIPEVGGDQIRSSRSLQGQSLQGGNHYHQGAGE